MFVIVYQFEVIKEQVGQWQGFSEIDRICISRCIDTGMQAFPLRDVQQGYKKTGLVERFPTREGDPSPGFLKKDQVF